MGSLMGKVAAVTGGAQGLGAKFALALASAGASVVVGDLASTASTCDAIRAIGGNARGVSLDVTSSASSGCSSERRFRSLGNWTSLSTTQRYPKSFSYVH